MTKKILCLLIVLVMICSLAACTTTGTTNSSAQPTTAGATATSAAAYPDYLNMDSYVPLVKEGSNVNMTWGIVVDTDYSSDPYSRWYWNMMKETMNINCEIEQVTNASEYVTLTFAANDLPDVLVGVNLSTTQLMNYGLLESQLLDLSKTMSTTLTPRMTKIFAEDPSIKAGITLPNGAIYAYPYVTDENLPTIFSNRQINTALLAKTGLKMPATLDDLISVLNALSKINGVTALAGGWKTNNPGGIILQALGFETKDSTGMSICLRDGKVVLPSGDASGAYEYYLKLMNQFYKDGVIDSDFFTIDQTTVSSDAALGNLGVLGCNMESYNANPTIFQQYTSLPALTSSYSSKAVVAKSNYFTCGGCVVSASTKYAALIARWADWTMTNEGTHAAWVGSHKTNTKLMLAGWGGWYMNDKYSRMDVDREAHPETWTSAAFYLKQKVAAYNMGSIGWVPGEDNYRQTMSGLAARSQSEVWSASPENVSYYWRTAAKAAYESIAVVDISNYLYFFDEKTSERVVELGSVLFSHIESETAKFITGVRAMSDYSTYLKELNSLGLNEYLKYYQEAYATYLKNLGQAK